MIHKTRNDVVERVEAYLVATGMSERKFGEGAVSDHKFVRRLREGKATLRTIEKAEQFMADHPPADTDERAVA